MDINTIEQFYFRHPFTLLLSGPSKAGKTTLIQKILCQARGGLVRAPPTSILYCYSRWQEIYDEIKSEIKLTFNAPRLAFQEGLPDLENIDPRKRRVWT